MAAGFGERGVVPTAVLFGVYKLRNFHDAQGMDLALFWANDLKAMIQWIKRTRRGLNSSLFTHGTSDQRDAPSGLRGPAIGERYGRTVPCAADLDDLWVPPERF